MAFGVLCCPKCGKWQVGQVKLIQSYILRCKFCGKSSKLKKKNDFGLVMKDAGFFKDATEAGNVCREKNLPERLRAMRK